MNFDTPAGVQWVADNAVVIVVIAIVITVFISAVVVLRKLWPSIVRTVLTMNAILTLPETLERHEESLRAVSAGVTELTGTIGELKRDVATVKHEVLPNSGGSLADEVHRQGAQLVVITDTQKSTQGIVRSQGRRLGAIEKSLELTQQPEAAKKARQRARLA